MPDTIISVSIKDRYALTEGSPVLVCGNSDYFIKFTFDEEWDAYEAKTARFIYTRAGKVRYQDVVFTGDTVQVPVLSMVQAVQVGVFAGNLRTTTPARIPCRFSVRCGTGEPEEPTPSQYDQIMALLEHNGEGKLDKNQGAENAGKALVIGEDGNVIPGKTQSDVELDTTLTESGKAADAKAVGDALDKILPTMVVNITDAVDENGDYVLDEYENPILSADKTFAEIMSHIVNGGTVVANYCDSTYTLNYYDEYFCSFEQKWIYTEFAASEFIRIYNDRISITYDCYDPRCVPLPDNEPSAGQIIAVSEVDEDGRIVATKAVDMPSGGGSGGGAEEKWELIGELVTEEEVQTVSMDFDPMEKVRCEVYTPPAASDTSYMPTTVKTGSGLNFYVGRFYPVALPRKYEARYEYRIAMEEYNGDIIMRFTQNDALARGSSSIIGLGTLGEATSNGNSLYNDRFTNKFITGVHFHSYTMFPVGSTFKFWGVKV